MATEMYCQFDIPQDIFDIHLSDTVVLIEAKRLLLVWFVVLFKAKNWFLWYFLV